MNKKTIITTLLIVAIGSAFAQQKPNPVDTNQLKSNIRSLSDARDVILKRKDISIADAVPLLNGLNQLLQADSDLLQFERAKKSPGKKN